MKKLLFISAFIFLAAVTHAQDDKSQMEKERQDIQKELSDLQKAYDQIKGQKRATLGQANVIKRKIYLQERYLNNINREIRYLNDNIYLSTLEIVKLQRDLDTMKAQYARSVVYAYKNRNTYSYLNFIFSAANFNDAMKRIAYLKSYRNYREQQVASIRDKQAQLTQRKQQQLGQIEEKKIAQQNQTKQVEVLADQKREKDVVISELKSKESDIKKEIATKQKRARQLQSQIDAIIARKLREAKEEADRIAKANANKPVENNKPDVTTNTSTTRNTAPVREKDYLVLNDKDRALVASFEKNKGQLPWPVDNGYVSAHFGPNKDEATGLVWDNPGITISTPSSGTTVKAIFDGEVTSVFNMGDGMAVMIQHGKYFTIYSNLSSASVSKGSSVTRGQAIGKAAADDDGNGGKVDLLLMKEKQKINPQPWLRK